MENFSIQRMPQNLPVCQAGISVKHWFSTIVKIVIILEHFNNILWTNPKPYYIIVSILQNFIGSVIELESYT